MAKKLPWFDNWKHEFRLNSCVTAAKYVEHKTGVKPEIHKTERYLVVNYMLNGQMNTKKIPLGGGVLYCLEEKDFEELFNEINSLKNPNSVEVAVLTDIVRLMRDRGLKIDTPYDFQNWMADNAYHTKLFETKLFGDLE